MGDVAVVIVVIVGDMGRCCQRWVVSMTTWVKWPSVTDVDDVNDMAVIVIDDDVGDVARCRRRRGEPALSSSCSSTRRLWVHCACVLDTAHPMWFRGVRAGL